MPFSFTQILAFSFNLIFLFAVVYTTDNMANHPTPINDSIALPKQEYLRLKQQSQAYRTMAARMFELPLRDPIDEVVADFRATDLYTDEFLTDLEDGLRKSSYTKKYANQTAQKRR